MKGPTGGWIDVGVAVHLLAEAVGGVEAARAVIAGRLRQGRLRARATSIIVSPELTALAVGQGVSERPQMVSRDNPDRPCLLGGAIWEGSAAPNVTIQWNWDTGSIHRYEQDTFFRTRTDVTRITLSQAEVEALLPSAVSKKTDGRVNSGAPRSSLWNEWISELAVMIHSGDIKPHLLPSHVIKLVADSLAERGVQAPSDETVRPVASKVLDRMREPDLKK